MKARWLVAAGLLLAPLRARAGACEELVSAARNHEARGDGDVAVRQYGDAVSLDPTCSAAWLGLGAIRSRMGDVAEAERVYTTALSHVPTLNSAIAARARARWQLGRTSEAEEDMLRFANATMPGDAHVALGALEELASWYASAHREPAELGVWRRIRVLAAATDPTLEARARIRVTALVWVVGTADPVSHPTRVDLLRSVAARLRL